MKTLRYSMLYLLLLSLIVTTACTTNELEEKIYNHLEETVEIEKNLPEIHKQLANLEKDENKSYERIFEESFENQDALHSIADEALEIINEQRELIKDEAEIIEQSEIEFDQIKPLIKDLDQDDVSDQAEKVYRAMMERYEIYDQWFKSYEQSLNINGELYELFFEETIDVDQFNALVESSNESFEQAQNYLTELGEKTTTYNNLKISFYESLDLNIVH